MSDDRHSVKLNLNRGKPAPCRGDFNGVARAGSGDTARLWAYALAADAWRGILVNAIAPGSTGTTGTPMSEEDIRLRDVDYPLVIGGPEPIARMVHHLLGPGGDWISGSILNVSGGEWKGRYSSGLRLPLTAELNGTSGRRQFDLLPSQALRRAGFA